jgi:cytochrome c2
MKPVMSICAVPLALALAWAGSAIATDLEEGEELYAAQCQACHGAMYEEETGFRERFDLPRRIQLAMLDSVTSDTAHPVIPVSRSKEAQLGSVPTAEHLAVALPTGPILRGIVGRPAAIIEGYSYSKAFLQTLKGVVWSEEELDRWITNSQARVPGSFMFYKQADVEARRKIILYLKANP